MGSLITNAGWVNLFTSLRGIMLEKLDMSDNSIGDIGINALTSALENNSTMKELGLSSNSIGDIGVTSISTVLRHPNSALQMLEICCNSIGDIVINSLTNSLLNNSMLKVLSIGGNPDVTPRRMGDFLNHATESYISIRVA